MNDPEAEKQMREAIKGAPQGYFVVVPPNEGEGIDLAELARAAFRSWKLLVGAALVAAILTAIVSLQLRPRFRAETLIAPTMTTAQGAAGLRGQIGGLASLVGLELGGGGRREEAIATLSSPGFARDFILSEKLMPVLFAEKWDTEANHWKPGRKAPTIEAGVRKFTESVRSVVEDRKTGIVTVAVKWYSPDLAAQWANSMVEMANERLRVEATRSAERSVEFLNKELAKTNVVELRQAIYGLIEEQVNNAMLANVQREYAFRFIDRAVAPDMRDSPKRTVMVIVGTLAGGFLALLFVSIRTLRTPSRARGAASI